MISLGVDTSTPAGSVGLTEGSIILAELNLATVGQHQERLLRSVDSLLDLSGIRMTQVQSFAVTLGPGSFTGLRVGIATVKGLALARGVPAYGISTLRALALKYSSSALPIAPLVDARRGRIYAALYEPGGGPAPKESLVEREVAPREYLRALPDKKILFCGDGVLNYRSLIQEIRGDEDRLEPDPCFLGCTLARWGARQFEEKARWSLADLKPNYIRPPDAEQSQGA